MIKLKPCPFCGGKAAAFFVKNQNMVAAQCGKCGVLQGKTIQELTEREACDYNLIEDAYEAVARKWNQRGGENENSD